ncbi:putative Fanconi anemia, complementation group I [Operophtera brumata]|uniref:Putative Fanconi anemia, complementation group I n=1 Tax=Operophtera brumata TaxID=104452 RepID=A0A0L7LHW5_OPEBR|nr:putative Fanconi anemia, complementation group I [Operophtera brumata]
MGEQQVFSELIELGRIISKREELQEYCNQQFPMILKGLPRRILHSGGECLLNTILHGLPDNLPESSRNKAKVIELVLETMRKESTSLTHCSGVVSRLCIELPKQLVEDLVRWCNDSVQSIVDDNDENMM